MSEFNLIASHQKKLYLWGDPTAMASANKGSLFCQWCQQLHQEAVPRKHIDNHRHLFGHCISVATSPIWLANHIPENIVL